MVLDTINSRDFDKVLSVLFEPEPRELPESLRMADLYSGIGGASLAARNLGIDVVHALEEDDEARRVYKRNFKIKPEAKLSAEIITRAPTFDVLYACLRQLPNGMPDVEDNEDAPFPGAFRYAYTKRPIGVVVEMPEGVAEIAGGRALLSMGTQFVELGYHVSHGLLNASDYGAGVDDRRSFLIARRGKPGEFALFKTDGDESLAEIVGEDQAYTILARSGFPDRWLNENEDASRMLEFVTPVPLALAVLRSLIEELRRG